MLTYPEVKNVSEKMAQHLDHLRQELTGLHVGRASAALVENILVESYGTKSPLKTMASITVPDAKTILIQPWNRDVLTNVEHAVRESDLGVTPSNNGIAVRITLPPMTEERRQELAKVVGKAAEETKIAMRAVRQEMHSQIQEQRRKSEITEDDFYAMVKELNEEIDKYNRQVDELVEKKEAELLAI